MLNQKAQTYVFKYLFDQGVYSGIKMVELSGKIIVKEVLYKELENGAVVVYKLVNEDYNLPFNDFYFATFDNTSSDVVFGVGYDIESALEDAEKKWQREVGGSNPFREVLEKLKEIEKLKEESNNMLQNYY